MSYLVFFEAIASTDYQNDENEKIEYLTHVPEIGDRISLGSQRLWYIAGIDMYKNPENPEDIVYLVHCTLDKQQTTSTDRSTWFRVKFYQDRDPNLQLFVAEGILLHVVKNLIGEKPETGYLLPQYNVSEHTLTSQPWGIASVTSYLPEPNIAQTCYNAIYVGHCVYVPEVLESEAKNRLTTA
ncbi:MAG: hypothetical protein HC849_05610 [Oscillatoriales cyanobacterium RU_3_3]|nr:hypothetical protein [Oscillatoriales cyanobacterium RU_3_3]NJR22057.1 hypothetical protein [Richelia sp. CSU_2_1]